MKSSILLIDDDVDICILLQKFLIKNGFEVDLAHSAKKGIAKFKENNYDVVLCDFRLGDKDGTDVLIRIKEHRLSTKVIIMTAYSDIRIAVNLIKLGAFDYITKPLIRDEVLNVINEALNQQAQTEGKATSSGGIKAPVLPVFTGEFLVSKSRETKELYEQIDLIARTNYSVIIYGESGTGKEVVARAIHANSPRKNNPFIGVDCGTLSTELANSELFGHMKGSFTGAYCDKKGDFELANGGTLFLDEVANLSYDIQAALLRVIQERKFRRVGGTTEMDLDIRIIVASHENLQNAYQKGLFREDLFHRLNEFSINIPPLRQRKGDIPLFAAFFLEKINTELGKQVKGFENEVMEIFLNYSWPGNLREFRNILRKSVLLSSSEMISIKSLPREITNSDLFKSENKIADIIDNLGNGISKVDLKEVTSEVEYQTIIKVLKSVNFNKTKAAEILRIDRKTLYNKIKSYDSH